MLRFQKLFVELGKQVVFLLFLILLIFSQVVAVFVYL